MAALLAATAVALAAPAPASALFTVLTPPCSATSTPGGDWPVYGADLASSRNQTAETTITPAAAAKLAPAWSFNTMGVGDVGTFQSSPVVADGCVYVATSPGTVYALDMQTGALRWSHAIPIAKPGLGGALVGAPAVEQHRVLVPVSEDSRPFVVALDGHTGAELWRSAPASTAPGAYTNGSVATFRGLAFLGYSAPEGGSTAQGGWVILDAATGATLKRTDTIPPADQARGYAGGGIWTTPAFDPATGYAYFGTGNPSSKVLEHPYTNAIVKVDMDRTRPTFGQVVASYKGNIDQYTDALAALRSTQACAASDVQGFAWPLDDPVCGQLDLDFGASPNLFTDATGRLLVGSLQKSGVYHAARADTMAPAWSRLVGLTCQACNAASTTFDGARIAGVATPGGIGFSLDRSTGAVGWRALIADVLHYQGISSAAGVVYTIDGLGFFDVIDAASGRFIQRRAMTLDGSSPLVPVLASSGVAVANHTVYAAAAGLAGQNLTGSSLIAYRPKG
jgi:outer membrane protein assembly factor BamB